MLVSEGNMTRSLALGLIVAMAGGLVSAEGVRLPVVQDNSIVMVDGEWSVNAGQASRLRLKGNQHIVAMSFDLSQIQGRLVTRAELVCHADAETLTGVTISTIAAPWDERASNGLTAGGAGVDGWGADGIRFPAVAGGNAFTMTIDVVAQPGDEVDRDGVYRWPIPADMVHAMATGLAHGLAIHEHDADYGRNPTIFSREQSAKAPFLLVDSVETEE